MDNEFKTIGNFPYSRKIVKVLSPEEAAERGLGPWPCKNDGDPAEGAEAQSASAALAQENLWREIVGRQYAKQFNVTELTQANQEAAKKVFEWANGPKNKGLRIVGPARTGKTRTASAALKTLVQEGKSIIRLDGQEFAFFATSAARNTDDGFQWIKNVCSHDVVFIDDFAKDFRDTTARVAQMIIERMFMNEKVVVLTTQFSQQMIEDCLLIGKDPRGNQIIRSENKHLVDSLNGRLSEYFETVSFT